MLLMLAAGSLLIASDEADIRFNLFVQVFFASWAALTCAFLSMHFLLWAFVHWIV